jgi:NTP pyrophosphatase (non-canonical NTP hydrolase)
MNQIDIVRRILEERKRQDEIHINNDVDEYLAIMVEEVGEVSRAILINDRDNLIEELVQVAAVAIRWMESL